MPQCTDAGRASGMDEMDGYRRPIRDVRHGSSDDSDQPSWLVTKLVDQPECPATSAGKSISACPIRKTPAHRMMQETGPMLFPVGNSHPLSSLMATPCFLRTIVLTWRWIIRRLSLLPSTTSSKSSPESKNRGHDRTDIRIPFQLFHGHRDNKPGHADSFQPGREPGKTGIVLQQLFGPLFGCTNQVVFWALFRTQTKRRLTAGSDGIRQIYEGKTFPQNADRRFSPFPSLGRQDGLSIQMENKAAHRCLMHPPAFHWPPAAAHRW